MPQLSSIDPATFALFRQYKSKLQSQSKDGKMISDSEALAQLLTNQ
jgi:hypothetical protein